MTSARLILAPMFAAVLLLALPASGWSQEISATPDATPQVRLGWYEPDARSCTIERLGTIDGDAFESDWSVIATVSPGDVLGMFSYVDSRVYAGNRYLYRVRWDLSGVSQLSSTAIVDVPFQTTTTLFGLRPNPAVGAIAVAFYLPDEVPARFELLDITGRRVLDRSPDWMSRGPGYRRLELGNAGNFTPGVYFLRMTHGADVFIKRAVLIR